MTWLRFGSIINFKIESGNTITFSGCLSVVFSSFMRAHAQAMNEYRGGEMSTEVVVDGNCGPLTEVKVSCERGSMVELLTCVCTDLVRGLY